MEEMETDAVVAADDGGSNTSYFGERYVEIQFSNDFANRFGIREYKGPLTQVVPVLDTAISYLMWQVVDTEAKMEGTD